MLRSQLTTRYRRELHLRLTETWNLKYRIATLFLIVTTCATLAGWIKSRIDARDALVAAAEKFDRVRGGVRKEAEARKLVDLSELCDPEISDQNGESKLRHLLVFAMWGLYWYESRIDLAYPDEKYAIELGGDILTALECTSSEQFFGLARDLYDDPEQWPEYFDVSEQEYVDYHDFVSRSCVELNSR